MIYRVLVLVMVSLLSTVAKAQLHSSVYDANQRKCVLLNTRSDNTLESLSMIGDDMTTYEFDSKGRLTEAVNSIATVEIKYEGDKAKAECTIDGEKMEYKVDAKNLESISMSEFRRQNEFINGSKSWDNFFTGPYAKLVFDIANNTIAVHSKSVQNCYLEVIKFVGRLRNGVNDDLEDKMEYIKTGTDAFQEYVKGGTPELAMTTLGYVIEKYPEWKDNFSENLYKFMNNHRKAQKRKNESKQAWKRGVFNMVSNGRFTIEEATKLIRKVERGEISIRELYGGFKYDMVDDKVKSKENGQDKNQQNIPASDPNIALNAVKQYLTGGEGFGKLNVVEVSYLGSTGGTRDWWKKYNPKDGKLKMVDEYYADMKYSSPSKTPHYYIQIRYTFVIYTAYVDPVGTIFYLEMHDRRGSKSEDVYLIGNGHLGKFTHIFDLYNWAP